MKLRILIVLSTAALTSYSWGATPSFSNLDLAQTDAIFRTFAADTAFRPVEPASSYGQYWGVSLGVVGILTSTSVLSAAIPSTASVKNIVGGNIVAGIQGPLGLGVEIGALPTVTIGGARLSTVGADAKWTINRTFTERSPIDAALRVMFTSARINQRQTTNGATVDVEFKSQLLGANLSVSTPLIGIFEPYVGYGMIQQNGTLASTGSTTIFNQNFTGSSSVKGENTSSWFLAGLQVRLLVLTISAEYDRLFGIDSYAAKVGFKI